MFQRTVLSASPSSLGSRYERSPRFSPHPAGASFEDPSSRRSSLDYGGNNAVSLPNSYTAKPPLYRETATKCSAKATIGFARPPVANEGRVSAPTNESLNNVTLGFARPASPGLLSLTLSEELQPPPRNRSLPQREARLADQFLDDVTQPWSLVKLQESYNLFKSPIVIEAYQVAARAHAQQLRKSGEPVLAHCVETAKILADINADEHMVAAALLHDVVDDTCVTFPQLQSWVAAEVYDLVKKVSKLSYMSQLVRSGGASLESFQKLKNVLVASVDCRAVLIKLADRIHNMRTLSALSPEKQAEWARETMELFVPLAGRLNCWAMKSELEDLAFAVLHPVEYHALKERYDAKVETFTEKHLQSVLNVVKSALDGAGIVYEDISGRPKNLYGVYSKMERKGYTCLNEVLDLFALRIVLQEGQSCHEALETVQKLWPSVPDKLKDYILHPKPNGYRSIHDVYFVEGIPLEVQIRDTQMHCLAEHGVAAHWRYKEGTPEAADITELVDQRTLWARYVLNFVFELNDKKLRPEEMKDSSAFVQRIWKTFWSFEGTKQRMTPCRHGTQRPCSGWSPVHVVISSAEGLQVCDATSYGSLETFLLEHCGMLESDGSIPIVNGEVMAPDYELQFGDFIEFCEKPPSTEASTVQSMVVAFRRDLVLPL